MAVFKSKEAVKIDAPSQQALEVVTHSSCQEHSLNPFRYRGYYYDTETGLYYLNSRYYDPVTGRFINADNQLSIGSDLTGMNLFAYCGNNPIMRSDPTGQAWWHWAIAAAVVVGCVVATVVTAGGFAAGAAAIGMAASGISVGGAAGVFAAASIGSGMALAGSAMVAASNSKTVSDFNKQGNWGTVVGGGIGGGSAALNSKSRTGNSKPSITTKPATIKSPRLPKNGIKINSSDALDLAGNYLGKGYSEVSTSRFVSADGLRQVRMSNADILAKHGGGPHINFDSIAPSKYQSVHVYIFD